MRPESAQSKLCPLPSLAKRVPVATGGCFVESDVGAMDTKHPSRGAAQNHSGMSTSRVPPSLLKRALAKKFNCIYIIVSIIYDFTDIFSFFSA